MRWETACQKLVDRCLRRAAVAFFLLILSPLHQALAVTQAYTINNVIDNMTGLKSFGGGTTYLEVYAQGYHIKGDGGGGNFRWVTPAGTDDKGSVVCPTSDPSGCWVRIMPGDAVNAQWWGATCNGDGMTDDSKAIQAAIDFADSKGHRTVNLPAGTCQLFDHGLTVSTSGQRIVCAGPLLTNIVGGKSGAPLNQDMISFVGSSYPGNEGGGVEACAFDGSNVASTNGSGAKACDGTTASGYAVICMKYYTDVVIRDNIILHAKQVATFFSVQRVSWEDVYANQIAGTTTNPYGIKCYGTSGEGADDIRIINGTLGFNDSTNHYLGIVMDSYCSNLSVFRLGTNSPFKAFVIKDSTPGTGSAPTHAQIFNFAVDQPTDRGIEITAGSDFWFYSSYIRSSATATGVYVANGVANANFIGGDVNGNAKNGLDIEGTDVTLSGGLRVAGNSVQTHGMYDGVHVGLNANNVMISGIQSSDNTNNFQEYGVNVLSGATNVRIIGNDLSAFYSGGAGWIDGTSINSDNVSAVANIGVGVPYGATAGATASYSSILNGLLLGGSSSSSTIAPYNPASTAANLDLSLLPKGTGLVTLGPSATGASNPASFQAKYYLPIKDKTGTTTYYIPLYSSSW